MAYKVYWQKKLNLSRKFYFSDKKYLILVLSVAKFWLSACLNAKLILLLKVKFNKPVENLL